MSIAELNEIRTRLDAMGKQLAANPASRAAMQAYINAMAHELKHVYKALGEFAGPSEFYGNEFGEECNDCRRDPASKECNDCTPGKPSGWVK